LRIAESGPDDFYRGETAAMLVDQMNRSNGLITRFVVDYAYEDKVTTDRSWTDDITGETHQFGLPSYWLVNARLSLLNAESWEVTLFGANLLDEEYLLDYTRFNRGVVQIVGLPRTYGLRFRYDF